MEYSFTADLKLYRVLVKYGGGAGTKEDPYIINYFDQLELMAGEQARGYFKQTDNLRFPEGSKHTPINTVNELKSSPDEESFEYDGGGYTIKGLTSPLFGTVSGSVIMNVNIESANIETKEYEYCGFVVSQAYNYRYEAKDVVYETGETIIKNCTVSGSKLSVLSLKEDGAKTENSPPYTAQKYGEFALGGITGLGGQIENCYVTDVTIKAEYDDYFLYAGGISGKPAKVINSGVYNVSIDGKIFNAGGIAGSAGGSRLYKADGSELPVFYGGDIQGCYVRGFGGYSENSAGGIAGEGSTNAEDALISNCYATGFDFKVGIYEDEKRTKLLKLGFSGGIIGSDGNENNGHLIKNTVSPEEYPVIGSVHLSDYDDTVRVAPSYAFHQTGILDVINKNTVKPNNPKEIFTGSFFFAEDGRNSDEGGGYALPAELAEHLLKFIKEGD